MRSFTYRRCERSHRCVPSTGLKVLSVKHATATSWPPPVRTVRSNSFRDGLADRAALIEPPTVAIVVLDAATSVSSRGLQVSEKAAGRASSLPESSRSTPGHEGSCYSGTRSTAHGRVVGMLRSPAPQPAYYLSPQGPPVLPVQSVNLTRPRSRVRMVQRQQLVKRSAATDPHLLRRLSYRLRPAASQRYLPP